ncbi:hypothetical protein OB959_24215 [Aeromonas bestiarum]|uniref:Uncharacterized protein n=1 Tax=Aeromonas bestiarum TaxID=105751 RepID=A0AAW7I643_9GAMM|nr:hypothetical protein [Aeromonas bestiarum]MDM5142855.1 hypothetical protein [Aeromonas bestiarum]
MRTGMAPFWGLLIDQKANMLAGIIVPYGRHYPLFFKQLAARIAIWHTRHYDYAII